MKVINKKLVSMLCMMVIILGIGIFLICQKDTDKITLDEVKLKEPKKESGMFAIMLQSSEGSEDYTQSEGETFPKEGYTLNEEKSGCLDSDGQKITEVQLSYKDGKVKVETGNTSYCYIYFDKEEPMNLRKACEGQSNMGKCIKNQSSKLNEIQNLNNGNKGDLQYRYVGTGTAVTNNYICFGTSSKCSISDNFMYRIIGITGNGQLKLIKNKAMLSTKWHKDYTSNVKWDSSSPSDLYTSLNGEGFLTNTSTYVPSGWESKISETIWNIGDSNADTATNGDVILNWEDDAQSKPAKIGLMYLSDYYYSYDGIGNTNCRNGGTSAYNTCKSSWLHISNSEISGQTGQTEWTMSRYGHNSYGNYYAWFVGSSGAANWINLNDPRAVRPVFYLDSSVVLTGEGTASNPYIIE